jgi:hypothetical protein
MKARDKILFFVGIFSLVILHWYLFSRQTIDGFFNITSDYDRLRSRLQKELGPYCKLANFVRGQVTEMQKGLGGSSSDISQMYYAVYECTDQLASVRPSCSRPNRTGMRYVPCSTFLDLPDWTSEPTAIYALSKIGDDLPERLIREMEWFNVVINKVKEGLAAGANPPRMPDKSPPGPPRPIPSIEQMNKYTEGFYGSCSPEASEFLRRKALEAQASSCKALTASSEIARVNALLNNPSVSSSVSRSKGLMNEMVKVQSDLEKLKNGSLYDWQGGNSGNSGPKRLYPKFEGGDRLQALLFSLSQNQ